MDNNQPVEFGENGAVINSPEMSPDRKKAYAGEIPANTEEKIDVPWWSSVPGLAMWFVGIEILNRVGEDWPPLNYWVSSAGILLLIIVIQLCLLRLYRHFSDSG